LEEQEHTIDCAFEDAGFEIRDEIQWIYGSGFPKSYNISKGFDKRKGGALLADEIMQYLKEYRIKKGVSVSQLDKEVFEGTTKYSRWYEDRNDGRLPTIDDWLKLKEYLNFDNKYDSLIEQAEREKVGEYKQFRSDDGSWATNKNGDMFKSGEKIINITLPSTELARQWDGWGTALKPAQEPIMVAQKPIEKNYCYNIEKYGVGGINIDDCRIPFSENDDKRIGKGYKHNAKAGLEIGEHKDNAKGEAQQLHNDNGRFPANIIFNEEAGSLLDKQSGILKSGSNCVRSKEGSFLEHGGLSKAGDVQITYGDEGGASRFFYCAKATKKDKNENGLINNTHVTVKPTELIKYLVKLVTPNDGICLDICEGSGTHVKAILQLNKEGFNFNYIGFENDEESYKIAKEREKINNIQ